MFHALFAHQESSSMPNSTRSRAGYGIVRVSERTDGPSGY